MKLSFIGAGKMATAICRGLLDNGVFQLDEIVSSDISLPARKRFLEITKIVCINSNIDAVQNSEIVVLAIKPQVAQAVLTPLNGLFQDKLLISIAAGLSIKKLCEWTGSTRVVRVMPNTPVMVGMGTSVFACSSSVTSKDKNVVKSIFSSVGIVTEMKEQNLDAVTGLSGSGPAYVYEFIQAMVDAAAAIGLEPNISLDLILQTISGATEMVRSKIGSPDELRDAVTSPGGTTEAGLIVLRNAGFRNLINEVVKAATSRSIELGRSSS